MSKRTRHMSRFAQNEVSKIFKKAMRVLKHPGLDVLCYPTPKSATPHGFGRILVITPKRVGNAPERNLVRRRLKSIFYEEKLYQNGLDYIIIIKKNGANLPFAQLKELLTTIDLSRVNHA